MSPRRSGKTILAMGGSSPFTDLMTVLMASTATAKSKLTPEQRAERKEANRVRSEQRILRAKILENICPSCEGKLVRGKKDRKNNYRRSWSCKSCDSSYSL